MDIDAFLRSMPASAPAPEVDFNGTWENQLGSRMRLTVVDSTVIGTYSTKVGETGGLDDFPLIGTASSDLIAFVVNWSAAAQHNSITAWVGQLTRESGREAIKTLWHLTTDVPDDIEPRWIWGAVKTGADTFRRA